MTEPENNNKRKANKSMIGRTAFAGAASVKPPVLDMIGRRLRNYYDEVARQPVPDRFLDLLNQLEAKTAKKE